MGAGIQYGVGEARGQGGMLGVARGEDGRGWRGGFPGLRSET